MGLFSEYSGWVGLFSEYSGWVGLFSEYSGCGSLVNIVGGWGSLVNTVGGALNEGLYVCMHYFADFYSWCRSHPALLMSAFLY